MNERFFDLKKEKQDRMINAGLRIFALNGYHHASTDEIVKEAQISKGLLFHYFGSKSGYYAFLYNYISRFVILQLRSEIRNPERDFFDLHREILRAETNLMEQYPCVFLYFESVKLEDDPEAIASIEDLDITVTEVYDSFEAKARTDAYPGISDFAAISGALHYIKIGLMRELLADRSAPVNQYRTRSEHYLELLHTLASNRKPEVSVF